MWPSSRWDQPQRPVLRVPDAGGDVEGCEATAGPFFNGQIAIAAIGQANVPRRYGQEMLLTPRTR